MVTSSKLVDDSSECLHSYQSNLSTDEGRLAFRYTVTTGEPCTIDAVYSYLGGAPFEAGAMLKLSLTQEKPFHMVSYQRTGFQQVEAQASAAWILPASVGLAMMVIIGLAAYWLKRVRK